MSMAKHSRSELPSQAWDKLQQIVNRFEDAWHRGERPAIRDYVSAADCDRQKLLVELVHAELELRLKASEPARVEEYCERYPELTATREAVVELIAAEYQLRRGRDPALTVGDYLRRFPGYEAELLACLEQASREGSNQTVTVSAEHAKPPADAARTQGSDTPGDVGRTQRPQSDTHAEDSPQLIGRYRVQRLLGQGGFGRVYLAYDDELHRPVAVKIPHRARVAQPEDLHVYLAEARILASLDHPHIVPVYDLGRMDDGSCFIVSKVIEGSDLATNLRESRPSFAEGARLVATVAEALHYAHGKGLVHRDVKPGNILLDTTGKPYLADFGLALSEHDFDKRAGLAGTPAYMSPEQARGEGHRVDGRSDIFSLGVVFYELLTGRRPFRGEDACQVLDQIIAVEARPLRQLDDRIPKELERICLKALAKRASERYTTAKDLADDLQHYLKQDEEQGQLAAHPSVKEAAVPPSTPALLLTPIPCLRIVPKGLRSFDAHDADFFLELLPGPRDRDGLPDSIRFWKSWTEQTDPNKTFPVGLIYGPSGCGKSSLVKAGLLPRLATSVLAVYVEATAGEVEARLLKALRSKVADLPGDWGLIQSLAGLRKGRFLKPAQKVLLVLDQFEQWLHANRSEENAELVQALRQCDGGRVQCLILVRDDFWLAVSRFMQALEIRVLEGDNARLVDLFDPRHARKILTAFGRAYGALPEQNAGEPKDQRAFLDQAVVGLAQEGKVIPVRLALFVEMVKSKPWTPATLRQMGGMEGVGVTFLEETFAAATAPPQHRLHQKAAQAVLKALLPEGGTPIKGHMRSRHDLLLASGYANRPKDFEELLHILDGELRLLTPTDPEGVEGEGTRAHAVTGGRYYQLTHDQLVPSLRDWLTRKQKESRRGRAELLLEDRAGVWNARPENRQLPSLLQWLQICWLTDKKHWTAPQRKMVQKATRYYAVRGLVVVVLVAVLAWAGYQSHGRLQARALEERLLNASTDEVPGIVTEMAPYRRWIDPLLRQASVQAPISKDARKQLHVRLALLPVDPTQVDYLYGRLLEAEPYEVPVIREFLARHRSELVDHLWSVVEKPHKGKEQQRLRSAAALASYDPSSLRWERVEKQVVNDLVRVPALSLARWMESFRPVRLKLLAPLTEVYRDGKRGETERYQATDLLADYAADQPPLLTDLLLEADEKQFAKLYPKVSELGELVAPLLTSAADRPLPANATEDVKEKTAKQRANAGVALVKLSQPAKAWPLLKHSRDPRARSYLIHRLGPLGADAGLILKRLAEEPDVTIRRGLILSLGPEEVSEEEWTPEEKQRLVQQMQEIYRTTEDPGLHAAAEWLLRQWHEEAWLEQTDGAWTNDKEQREKRLESIRQELAREKQKARPHWYLTGQGQTLVVLPGPVEFVMGSPPTEMGRNPRERQHRKRIGRTFAIAAKPVTLKHYLQFQKEHNYIKHYAPNDDCPVHGTNWYMAAAYCNWLSRQEGIPKEEWCYQTDPQGQVIGLRPNYLRLHGYRLPTEAEWEYACRAGSVTSRYYGETEELLKKYAWFRENSKEHSWPVGSKKPNDLGLFDMHGNIWNWCQESYKEYPKASDNDVVEDDEDVLSIVATVPRLWRGGSYSNPGRDARAAHRNNGVPSQIGGNVGFRVARTFP